MISLRVVLSSLLCALLAVGCASAPSAVRSPEPASDPTASPAPAPSPPPTALPTPAPAALPSGEAAVEPGRYFTEFDGYRYTVSVSEDAPAGRPAGAGFLGWASVVVDDLWGLTWDGEGAVPNSAALLIYGNVSGMNTDACQWAGTTITPGPTVDDFATALAALDGFQSSEPTDVTVGGYHGKRLRLTLRSDVNFAGCRDGEYRSFEGRSYDSPGQTDDVRILNLDGTRHLFFTTYQPGTPAETRTELEQMVESLEIEPVGD